MTNSKFSQIDEHTVRVTGSSLKEAEEKTLKLEGVKCLGFRTICPATIYDTETIRNIDFIKNTVTDFVRENTKGTLGENDYSLSYKTRADMRVR